MTSIVKDMIVSQHPSFTTNRFVAHLLQGEMHPMILDPYAQYRMPLIMVAAAEIDAYSRFTQASRHRSRPGNSCKSLKWSYSAEKGTLEISPIECRQHRRHAMKTLRVRCVATEDWSVW